MVSELGGALRLWRHMLFARIDADAASRSAGMDAAATHRSAVEPFEQFIHRYERAVLNYLWHLLGEEQSAFDLTQETFLRAWQQYATLSTYAEPRAWLFRVASNLAFSQLRRMRAPVGAAIALDDINGPSTSDHARRLAERDLVRQVLDRLPPQRRAALVLREIYGLTCEEIAQALETSPGAIKTTLWRAREQFRAIYAEEDRS